MVPEQRGQYVLDLFRILNNAPIEMKVVIRDFPAQHARCVILCASETRAGGAPICSRFVSFSFSFSFFYMNLITRRKCTQI